MRRPSQGQPIYARAQDKTCAHAMRCSWIRYTHLYRRIYLYAACTHVCAYMYIYKHIQTRTYVNLHTQRGKHTYVPTYAQSYVDGHALEHVLLTCMPHEFTCSCMWIRVSLPVFPRLSLCLSVSPWVRSSVCLRACTHVITSDKRAHIFIRGFAYSEPFPTVCVSICLLAYLSLDLST